MELRAYRMVDEPLSIVPGVPSRPWMDEHPSGLAHRCHPLLIANQAGWVFLNPCDVDVRWNGRPRTRDLRVKEGGPAVISNFGGGIVTWRTPFLFRTPPGWHL